jgi:hypothetical protein
MKYSLLNKLKSKCTLTKSKSPCKQYENEPWFKSSFNREQTDKFLKPTEIGTFVVRKSESTPNSFALSVKVPKYMNMAEISHYLIVQSKEGFCIKGLSKHFDDLKSLITHCSYMRDMIPIMLNLDFYKSESEISDTSVKKSQFLYYFSTSTTSLGSTVSSTSDFFEDFSDMGSTSSLNLCE